MGFSVDNKFSIAVVVEHDQNGIKPVTYEVIYGHAWQPLNKKNEQSIKLDDIKKQLTK